jgi:hypothetical protein
MASDLTNFGLQEMLRCSKEVRRSTRGTTSMEEAAREVCRFLREELVGPDGKTACPLVRCYKTHRFSKLQPDLQEFARPMLQNAPPGADVNCLTLLATVGSVPEWNSRHHSRGHRAIALVSPQVVERAPMIAQLIRQFGLDISAVVDPDSAVVRDLLGKTYGVFHVERALGSPYIPAQNDFVVPYNIRSVVGFGGSLASGQLFAVILFSRVHVSSESADRFRTLALDVKSCLFPFDEDQVFAANAG